MAVQVPQYENAAKRMQNIMLETTTQLIGNKVTIEIPNTNLTNLTYYSTTASSNIT